MTFLGISFIRENADYFLLLSGSLAALATVELLLRRYRKCYLPSVAWVAVIGTAIAGFWATKRAGEDARANIETIIESLAPTYAAEMSRLGHAKLTLDTPADDPLYLSMIDAILEWQRLSTFAHDIYTIRKLPDGRNALIVDSETDYNRDGKFEGEIEERIAIGTIYEEADAGMEAALRGKANFNPEIVKDEWGEWVGAWAPIFGPDGKVDAVLGVDFRAEQWLSATAKARWETLLLLGLTMAAGIGGGAFFGILKADIRRRIDAELRSRKAEQRMALTLKRMPLAFIEWSALAECITWNPSAERVFGHRAEDVLGKKIFPLIVAPGAKEHVDKIWTHLIRQVGGSHSINDNVTKDGRLITCEWFNTPLVGPDGHVTGVLSIVQDITERMDLEKHVQEAERLNAVGQLAAGVAHDFNNILTIITGHTGLLLGEEGIPNKHRPDLEHIEEAAFRASALTKQLLAFSRQHAMFPRPLHLGEVVENSASMLGRILGASISFNVEIGKSPPIEGDPALLDQVLTNLVLNARDALMPQGGVIDIYVGAANLTEAQVTNAPDARPGPAVCLSIRDNGTGIPPEAVDHIFEPFFTTKQPGKGTGLGLSVVHGIVKQHHGWIDLHTAVGKGTEFRLYFPPTDKTPAEIPREPAPQPPRFLPARRRTILLVEDESVVRKIARMILERAGYRIIEAGDGVEAMKLWIQHADEVDLLLTDMVMPNGLSGRDLALRILSERPDLPVIYASGYSLEMTLPDFHESERHVFMQKPYLTDQLVSTVRKSLGEHTAPIGEGI